MPSSKKRAWLTPDSADALADLVCKRVFVPDSQPFRESVNGALLELTYAWNWEQFGSMTPEETADAMRDIYDEYMLNGDCVSSDLPTPFWDTPDDLDDEASPATESWYGYVDNPEGDPATIGFFESAAIWTITGLLAISGNVGAAIAFHTIAPRFHLAIQRGDVGEIIRILFDDEEKARVNTASYAPGDVIRVPIVGDETLSTHTLMIIKAG